MERNIKLLGIFNFFTDLKFHAAVLIIYFTKVTGSYTLATTLFSVVMISSALFEVPTGIFSDKIGRKRTVIFGALSATTSAVLYAMGTSYWILFMGAIFEGLSRAWYSGNNDALLYDSLKQLRKPNEFSHHLGKVSSMFQLSLMIGAVTGSIMAQWSFQLIMWLSVIPQIIGLVVSFQLIDPERLTKESANIYAHIKLSALHLWNNKKLRLLSAVDILNFAIGEASFKFGAAFIETVWPIWAIGFSRMISFGSAFVSFRLSGKVIKKIGDLNILLYSNVFTRIVNFIALGFPSIISPLLMSSTAILYGAREVSINNLMQKEYTHEQRATLASLSSLIGNILFGVIAPLVGLLADAYGPAKALLVAQVGMLSIAGIVLKLKSTK